MRKRPSDKSQDKGAYMASATEMKWSIHHRDTMQVTANSCRSGMVCCADDTLFSYTTATDLGVITTIALLFNITAGACTVQH